MTCKDCVHYEVCVFHTKGNENEKCMHFKPKSRFVELPCEWETIGVKALIDRQPTADVVEVVRCKECKHWGGIKFGFVCRKFSGIETKICMGADHFCSYGEKALKEREKK